MAFWEDFGGTISMKGKEMADKAKNLTDIASLKGQIVSYENALSRNYKELGRVYYEAHKDDFEKEFPDQMEAVENAERMIEDLEKRIGELKGTKRCESCGNDVADDSVYCPKCGVKLENEQYFDEDDAEIVDVVVTEETAEEDADVIDEE